MEVVYAHESAPESYSRSLFLAGPTPRSADVASWRPEALRIIERRGYDGVVFVPEPRDGNWLDGYINQIEWEEKHLHMADCILFWIPRDLTTLPGFTTNVEWGAWQDSGKVVLGMPQDAPSTRYLRYYADKLYVDTASTLEETINAAIQMLGDGAMRSGGERDVPLYVWRTQSFQQWYVLQKSAGNRLDGARVEWTFRVGPKRATVLFLALHVDVYIARENRHKSNDVMIARPDIVAVVMYRRREPLDESDMVLIREFRSPAVTRDGFVHEVPGGSSFKPRGNTMHDVFALAADECREETGLSIETTRFRMHLSRQLVATLSAHKAHLFSVELTDGDIAYLRSQEGAAYGVAEDTERTYVELTTLGKLKQRDDVDWSMLGMILSVIAVALLLAMVAP